MKGMLLMFLLGLAIFSGCASTEDDNRGNSGYERDRGQSGHRH